MPESIGYPPLNIPIPDPSTVTAQEIAKTKAELRREFEILLKGYSDTTSATRDGYIRLFEARLDGAVQRLDERVSSVLLKFEAIDQRLSERDRRFDSVIVAHKEAANAQIQATVSALVKTETSFTKEFDGIKTLINAAKEGFYVDVANLKGRLDRGEGGSQGVKQQTEEHRATTTVNTLIVSGVVGFLVLIVMIAGLWITTHTGHSQEIIPTIRTSP